MRTKIYLVVLESDKSSITTASLNQFTSHRLCHVYAEATHIPHSVVTEELNNIPLSIIKALLRQKRFYNEWTNSELLCHVK